jgi:hypothetical protein
VAITTMTILALGLPALPGSGAPPSSEIAVHLVGDWLADGDGWFTSSAFDAADTVLFTVEGIDDDREVAWRTRTGDAWSPWRDAHAHEEHAPDPGSAEASTTVGGVSEPIWTGHVDAIQLRSDARGPLELVAVETREGLGWRPSTDHPAAAHASVLWPRMIPRSAWDPTGECVPTTAPEYAPDAQRLYVHHTAVFPHYLPEEADDAVRAMCISHVESRGFSDIGYNFLIDQYGVIYQGRIGGILRPVVGAHASGFNQGSVGVAVIGNFEENDVPAAALEALDELLTWLADWHGIDPGAVTPHVSTGGATTRFPAGEEVALAAISGHRDTATDSPCPGGFLYAQLPGVRERVAARLAPRDASPAPPAAAVGTVVADDAPAQPAPPPATTDEAALLESLVKGARVAGEVMRAGAPDSRRLIPRLGSR